MTGYYSTLSLMLADAVCVAQSNSGANGTVMIHAAGWFSERVKEAIERRWLVVSRIASRN